MYSSKKSKGLLITVIIILFCCIADAQNINTPNKMGPLGTQINTLSGNLYIPRNDLYIPARGFDLDMTFFYNSYNFDTTYGFGNGWGFKYFIKYKIDTAGNNTIIWGDGREDVYTPSSAGSYQSPAGFFNTLTQYQPGQFLLSMLDGSKYYFDNNAVKKVTKMTEPNGNYISFNYTDSLLTGIANNQGQTISLKYDGTGRLSSVTEANAIPSRTWAYAYDQAGNLATVTDPLGGTNKYAYLVNGPMKSISDKNNNTVDIIYNGDFSVSEMIGCNKRESFSYDTTLNKTIVTDYLASGRNQVTTYGYGKTNNQAWLNSLQSNCCGYDMTFKYDNSGNKIQQTDANGNVTSYTYDTIGNMLTETDALNQTISFTYTPNFNNISSFTDAKGNTTTFNYSSTGNITQITDPGGLVYTATYNRSGDIISSTDPKGNVYTYNYDAFGHPTTVTGPEGYNATLAYDARGNLLSYEDARGNSSSLYYDILNRLKTITDPINNSLQFSYDAEGNITSYKDQNNVSSNFGYDASDRLVQFTDAINNKATASYDAMDNPTTIKDALGNANSFTYDTKNRLSSLTDALGNSSSLSYDPNGNILSVNLPNGNQINYTYDAINRITSVKDNSGAIANLTYDKNNNLISYTNGTGATVTASYDNLDRVNQFTDPLGNSYSFTYEINGNVNTVTDRNGFVKAYTYDGLNRVKTFTDNNGSVITLAYDAQSNVSSMQDQNDNITSYTYDNLNRLTATTYPDGKFTQYTYDSKGNIAIKTLTDGTIIKYVYDSLNRISSKRLPSGIIYSYTYDALSRVIAATNDAGTVNITYDALSRITSETFDGRTTSYTYNVAGRTQTMIYPDSTIIIKNFDTRNRIISILKNNTLLVSYQYNNSNQVIVKNFANGVNTNMQYDFANRLSNISTAGGAIQNSNFTYDNEMNKTAVSRLNTPSLSEQYSFDKAYRLTNFKKGSLQNTYTYDAEGNRVSANMNGSVSSYTINNLNQITGITGNQNSSLSYDNNGNLIFDGVFYKKYDGEGRLLKDSASPVNVITYLYDAVGRRVQKIINGATYKYTYSGMSQIEQRDGITNSIINRTIYSGAISPVVNENNSNQYFYHQNELNSVEAITDGAGNVTETYQYDIYGKPTIYNNSGSVIPASLAGNRFGFTGQEYDSATKSNHFFYRDYSTTTGTFNQRDLIGYADGTGMYQYVHDNPANGIDIFGLDDCGGHATSTTKTWTDYTDQSQWWSGQFSNVGSFLQVFQSSTTRMMVVRQVVWYGGYSASYLQTIEQHGFLGNASSFVNSTPLSVAMVPFNIANTITPAIDMYYNGSEMSAGDIYNNTTGIISGGSTTGVGLYGLSGGSLTASGLAASPLAFGTVAVAGGLAIEGGLDAAYEKATGYVNGTGKGDHFTDVGAHNDIPGFTDAVSWLFSGPTFDHTGFGNSADQRTTDNMSWTYSDSYVNARNKINNRKSPVTHTGTVIGWKPRITNCPQNNTNGGKRYRKYWFFLPNGDSIEVVQAHDPNALIAPTGVATKHWVSIKDNLPFTILYENSVSASAPAKFVSITTPVMPKEDAATFQLGSFGFNNLTFNVPAGTSSYYQRLDARDSLGLFVDVTAGYNQITNQAFWQFQSIDPLTLLPPSDPLKGFLLLQDSSKPLNGHGFVNFSIKPLQTDHTLDTIAPQASVVFDQNDTIPTNITLNTVDAVAPTSQINTVQALTSNATSSANSLVKISWSGSDDAGGSGISYYTVYVSNDQTNFSVLVPKVSGTDTTVSLATGASYCFFVLGTDSTGNTEILKPGQTQCFSANGALPVTWLYFTGKTVLKNNILSWATSNEINNKQFTIERSLNGTSFSNIGTVAARTGTNQSTLNYQFTDYGIDKFNGAKLYYRLQQTDIDGIYSYSNIIVLTDGQNSTGNSIVYPNPTPGLITILVGNNNLVGSTATLYDINGRVLQNILISNNSQQINLGNYVNGTYFIKLKDGEMLKVIKGGF